MKQLTIFDMLQQELEEPEKEVQIKNVINVKTSPINNYECSLSYGDLTLIIAMLHDYVRGFDRLQEQNLCPLNETAYQDYYRNKFLRIAEKIESQIEYDYETKLKNCLKKVQDNDIGEDALVLALKKAAGDK